MAWYILCHMETQLFLFTFWDVDLYFINHLEKYICWRRGFMDGNVRLSAPYFGPDWNGLQLLDRLRWHFFTDIHGTQRMNLLDWWSPDFSSTGTNSPSSSNLDWLSKNIAQTWIPDDEASWHWFVWPFLVCLDEADICDFESNVLTTMYCHSI